MDSIKSAKAEFRKEYLALRDSADSEAKAKMDSAICTLIASMDEFVRAENILIFYPAGSEADLLSLFYEAKKSGKSISFPRCEKERRGLVFHKTESPESLKPGVFGIPAPSKDSGGILTRGELENSFCVVPALSVDRDGYRLGYGGGYYDRFLSSYKGVTVAPVYSFLISEKLPREEYDIPVGYAVTEEKIIKF